MDEIILIIEDDCETADLLSKYLRRMFFSVEVASDGEEGLQKYRKYNPSIILCDITMPKLNGIELVKIIRKEDLKTNIIMITAYNDQNKMSEAVKLGLDDYLIKPIELNLLKSSIMKIIRCNKKERLPLIDGFYWEQSESKIYTKDATAVALSKNETLFLKLLCENPNNYFSKNDIAEHLYDDSQKVIGVRTLISRLKAKLNTDIVESMFGNGYKIKLSSSN